MNLVLFEDSSFRTLAPLSHPRPVFFLRAGVYTAEERVRTLFPGWSRSYLCRAYLAPSVAAATDGCDVNIPPKEDCLFLNGSALTGGRELSRALEELPVGTALISGGRLHSAKVESAKAFALFGYLQVLLNRSAGEPDGVPPVAESVEKLKIKTESVNLPLAVYPWNLVGATERMLEEDCSLFRSLRSSFDASVSSAAHLISKDSIYIGNGVRIDAGAVIDAGEGSVILDEECRVMANAVICGPCYIGKRTTIKVGAKIYGPCSFGPVCKLGGEIAETVIQGYSNKQHDGFLGHAYLGEWVNLGAGTEVSDLKNNYGPIRVWADDIMVDSGEIFVGPTIGDHSKTGINSMLNSGCVIGFCSNVFGSEYLPKFVPSFSWGGADELVEYDLEKAIETARVVMSRRSLELGQVEEDLFREIYNITRSERDGRVGG